MKPPDRFNIHELAAQYQYHPDLRDIYVEGRQDKIFFQWFLNELGLSKLTAVYESQAVNVGASTLAKHGIKESGEKARLIALSLELRSLLNKGHKHLMFVVDADFDHLFGSTVDCDFLFYTDGTSLESYFVCPRVVGKFFDLALRDFSLDPAFVLDQICPVLSELFILRATNERLGWNLSWLPFAGLCKVDAKGSLVFRNECFVREYLSKNGRLENMATFSAAKTELKSRLGAEMRKFIRGHDFTELLSIILRRYLHHDQKNFRDPNILAGTLFCCLEAQKIKEEPLLRKVTERMVSA